MVSSEVVSSILYTRPIIFRRYFVQLTLYPISHLPFSFFVVLFAFFLCPEQVEGFEKGSKNTLICATNRKSDLDTALVR